MPRKSMLARRVRSEAKSSMRRRKSESDDEAKPRTRKRKSSSSGAGPSWLKKGREEVKKQKEKNQTNFKPFIPEFWLNDDERALIKIAEPLDDLERTVSQHVVQNHGKGRKFVNYTCTQDKHCPFCKQDNRASVRWPLLVFDLREMEYTDRDTKKKVKKKGVVKMWLPSINELDAVTMEVEDARADEEDDDIDVDNSLWRVTRKGTGSSTKYFWKRVKASKITASERKRLKEFEEEHGTLIEILAPPDKDEARKAASRLQSDDEDEDEDDYDDEDESDDDYEDYDDE